MCHHVTTFFLENSLGTMYLIIGGKRNCTAKRSIGSEEMGVLWLCALACLFVYRFARQNHLLKSPDNGIDAAISTHQYSDKTHAHHNQHKVDGCCRDQLAKQDENRLVHHVLYGLKLWILGIWHEIQHTRTNHLSYKRNKHRELQYKACAYKPVQKEA